jgi:hypothetical protein
MRCQDKFITIIKGKYYDLHRIQSKVDAVIAATDATAESNFKTIDFEIHSSADDVAVTYDPDKNLLSAVQLT